MPFSRLPALAATFFLALAADTDARHASILPVLLAGALFAKGRRTVTSWIRKAGLAQDFRRAYSAVRAAGQEAAGLSRSAFDAVAPVLGRQRLLLAIDDTPTKRYGPCVQGAGIHRHPSPGPADEAFLYGHVFVTLAALAKHPRHGVRALPLHAFLYIRKSCIPALPPRNARPFRKKTDLAADQLRRAAAQAEGRFEEVWAVVDGGYACRAVLDAAREEAVTVVGRLRKDAALRGLPAPRKPGRRGRPRTYGDKLSLAKRAAHPQGWQQTECEQYGRRVVKTIKTFLATWGPARGLVRVVLVKEDGTWLAFFCTKADATAEEILSAAADRNALEQGFKDVKEVWGAGQQQVRDLHASEGCFNLCLWLMSAVEAWAWDDTAR